MRLDLNKALDKPMHWSYRDVYKGWWDTAGKPCGGSEHTWLLDQAGHQYCAATLRYGGWSLYNPHGNMSYMWYHSDSKYRARFLLACACCCIPGGLQFPDAATQN